MCRRYAENVALAPSRIQRDAETATRIDISGNVSDVDGSVVLSTTAITTLPGNGNLVNNGNGTFTYTGNLNFVGVDSFTYTVSDGAGGFENAFDSEGQQLYVFLPGEEDYREYAKEFSTFQYRVRDDHRQWKNEKSLSLGTLGETNPYIKKLSAGVFRSRQYQVIHSDLYTDFIFMGLENDIQPTDR